MRHPLCLPAGLSPSSMSSTSVAAGAWGAERANSASHSRCRVRKSRLSICPRFVSPDTPVARPWVAYLLATRLPPPIVSVLLHLPQEQASPPGGLRVSALRPRVKTGPSLGLRLDFPGGRPSHWGGEEERRSRARIEIACDQRR